MESVNDTCLVSIKYNKFCRTADMIGDILKVSPTFSISFFSFLLSVVHHNNTETRQLDLFLSLSVGRAIKWIGRVYRCCWSIKLVCIWYTTWIDCFAVDEEEEEEQLHSTALYYYAIDWLWTNADQFMRSHYTTAKMHRPTMCVGEESVILCRF